MSWRGYVDFGVWDFARRGHPVRLSECPEIPPAMGSTFVGHDGLDDGGPFDGLEVVVVGHDVRQDLAWVRCPLCERCQNATAAGE